MNDHSGEGVWWKVGDKKNKMKLFKKIKKCIGTGHINHGRLEEKLPKKELHNCPHDSYCFIRKQKSKEHCSEHYALHCGQPMKYYNKWKENGNSLGVGS